MPISKSVKICSTVVLCSGLMFEPTIVLSQDAGEQAIATRQGYMKLVLWEAGPLFGMAKGDLAYDAEAAKQHAAILKTISQYPVGGLFTAGTSNADHPDKTRALPKIWDNMDGFGKAFTDWQAAVAGVGDVAGNGQPALAEAVAAMGKSCGGCHKPFRAPKS